MPAPSTERTGVLVVRAWLEDDRPDALRARITSTLDLAQRELDVTPAEKPEQVLQTVKAWLDAFLVGTNDDRVTAG
jgi:hypothetical protein